MNEKLKAMAEQAGLYEDPNGNWKPFASEHVIGKDLERFAELVRQDEANGMRETYMKMIHGAIAEEREFCAKLCDDREQSNLYGVKELAKAIRARGNHEQT